jgi:predicted nucleic acid-binding protein
VLAILDSTVLIDFLRGRPVVQRVAALRDVGDVPATTAINVEEIVRGVRPSEHRALDTLAAGLVVLPIDEAAARIAGSLRREYAARGTTLWQADCLIAAAAERHGARLCTGNPKDFPMIDVDHWPVVEHWPVGE